MSVLVSVVIGLAVGYLLGWMSRRRKKNDDENWPTL
jgi:NhaP-type Na+/H+ or K+/H+ antiporter